MGYTMFYKEAGKDDSKITWKDIFSESFRPHTKEERDYAMTVGTTLQRVNESNMLQTWHKPWLWFYYGKFGMALVVLLFVAFFGSYIMFEGTVASALYYMTLILPPIVVPVIVMIFFWELNIPQNISLSNLLIYFLVGGILSFIVTSAALLALPSGTAWLAPLREEPAKLIPSLLFLWYFEKRGDEIYGITGLVIGGAVGAGFSAFESVEYALQNGFITEIVRIIFAIGGHMVFCAPYVAAFALAVHKKGSFSWDCLLDKDFLMAYLIANAIHAAWNASEALIWFIPLIIVMWVVLLYWVRKCMAEVVREGHYISSLKVLRLVCIAGAQKGQGWQCSIGGQMLIGKEPSCTIQILGDCRGVSRRHCSIQYTEHGWTIRDLNSTYGTYLSDRKLLQGEEVSLRDSEVIYLGSKLVGFRVIIQ